MKTPIRQILMLAACGMLLMTSCVKDEFNMDNTKIPGWEPNFAAPLINTRLTIWDILNDQDSTDIVVEDETNFLYLVYKSRVYSQSAEELITIPDQSANAADVLNTGGPVAPGDSFVTSFTYHYDFNFPSSQVIDSLFLKGGNMNMSINTSFNMPAKVELTLPGSKNGGPFKETINMAGPNANHNVNLNNTKLLFHHSGGNNRLQMDFRIVLYGDGSANLSPYSVAVSNSFTDVQFRAMFGYLGQLNFALSEDTVSIKLYDNNVQGIVNWEDPRIYLYVTNYLGMPVELNINYLEAVRTKTPTSSVQITGPGIPSPWNILYPNFSQIGQGIRTDLLLDKTNSNVNIAFNISPQRVNALVDAMSNPGGYSQNFTFDTSRFMVDALVELPMHGTAHDFVIVDTIDIDLGEDFEEVENIEWVLFKIYAENGFPVDAKLQVYFTDENHIIVDSLIAPPQQFVFAATPGPAPDYIVTQPYTKTITTTIHKERLLEYHRIKYAIVRAEMNTFNNATQIVKIYSYYNLHIMLGAQVQLKF